MPPFPLIDRLLVGLFRLARNLFVLQALAFGSAAAATLAVAGAMPAWALRALVFGALLSATFAAAAVLLWRMQSWTPQRNAGVDPGVPAWVAALAISLILIVGLTLMAAAGLPALWRDISDQLTAIGFWDALTTPSQFGGIVTLPILLALCVPALVTAAAMFSCLFAIVLLARLPFRPVMFPTIASMGAVVQSTLVVAGWLATALTRELSQAAVATMSAAPDQEVLQLADQLTAAVAMLTSAATMLIAPTAVLVAWCVFLRPSGRAAAHFGRDVVAGSEEVPIRAANPTGEVVFAVNTVASRRAAPSPTLPPLLSPRNAGVALIGLGILMLLFAGVDRLRARPAYVASTPEAGAQIASGPPVIRVTFDHALDSASTLSVVYLPPEPRLDDISRDVPASSRLASTDVDRRTLEAIPERIGRGLYLVRWVAYPESGGVTRHGSFTFGVGLPVPPDRRGMIYTLSERDSGNRGRRSTVAGGLLLLAIGALPWARP